MKASIKGKAVPKDWKAGSAGGPVGGLYWRTAYPGWDNGQTVHAPSAIQVDVYVQRGLYGIGLLSVHRLNKIQGDRTSVAGYEIYRGDDMVLVARDGQGNDKRVHLKRGLFHSDEWNTLRIDFEVDGSIIPYINGQNAYVYQSDSLKVPVDDEHEAGFIDGHAGIIYANSSPDDQYTDGQYLLNDNFMILEYR